MRFPRGDSIAVGRRELGPDGGNIHAAGEFVSLDDVVEVADIVTRAAADFVG